LWSTGGRHRRKQIWPTYGRTDRQT